MGNLNSTPVNITAMNKCMTVQDQVIRNGTKLVSSDCTGDANQVFDYDSQTKEIKYGNKCLDLDQLQTANGTHVQLWQCNGGGNQKWNFGNKFVTTQVNTNKCLDIAGGSTANGTPIQIWDCWGGLNQQFMKKVVQGPNTQYPHIIRTGMVIPSGTLPIPQLSILPPHSVLFVNNVGKSILVNANFAIDRNSKEMQCLGNVRKFILAPLTTLRVIYRDGQDTNRQLVFKNDTPEHDLIYDQATSFTQNFKDLINEIIAYDVVHDDPMSIKTTVVLNKNLPSGNILMSKFGTNTNITDYNKINLLDYVTPSQSTSIAVNSVVDYILGPCTMARIGNVYLYNSGDKPLFYEGLTGIDAIGSSIQTSPAAPLNSGYAIFTLNCDYTGTNALALIGEYSTGFSMGTASTQNYSWTGGALFSNDDSQNPIDTIGRNRISGVIVGPYTKVTLFHDTQFQGLTKVFENNTPNEIRYSLCIENFNDVTTSIKIEYASTYVGFGLISLTQQQYVPMSYDQACPPDRMIAQPKLTHHYDENNPLVNKMSANSETANISDMPNLEINCGTNPLVGFELISDKNGYHNNYTCDSRNNYETTTIQTQSVPTNSLNQLNNIHIDCGGKAITGVKTTVEGNTIMYEYMCGDQNLTNIQTHHSTPTIGYPYDINPLLGHQIACRDGNLTSVNLSAVYDRPGPAGNMFKYSYTYKCGRPRKEEFKLSGDVTSTSPHMRSHIDQTANLTYRDGDTEYYTACPCGSYRTMRLPSDDIEIDGDNVAVDLRQASGKYDTVHCNGKPITVKNKNYVGVGVRPKEKFTVQSSSGCLDWFHIILLVIIILLLYIAYKKKCLKNVF
jgi:hypothetical protein